MTTHERLAAELRKVAEGTKPSRAAEYEKLAVRAATGEFDDYSDVHVCGPTALYGELKALGFNKFATRVADGEFDATLAESEAWARAQTDPETVRIMEALGIGPDRSKDN
jgi:hypothetical protein